jgi:hypothetical protein
MLKIKPMTLVDAQLSHFGGLVWDGNVISVIIWLIISTRISFQWPITAAPGKWMKFVPLG